MKIIYLLILVSAILAFSIVSIAKSIQESRLEAAFIYQFTNYVTWSDSVDSEQQPFVIGLITQDLDLQDELESLAKTKKVRNRAIEVVVAESASSLKKCNIIMVKHKNLDLLHEVIRKFKGTGTLIVTHGEGFAKQGAMINFFQEGERLKFEINQKALKHENLQVGSQLLNLARLINTGE
ncbi:MAG: YfiR family protein [Pseudobdellovibrionaceae bacterium]